MTGERTVCVLGSFMMDLSVRVPQLPVPGETVVGTSFDMFLGGKGFNQAVAAQRSGAPTVMVGRLGGDDFGARFLNALRDEGIDSTHVTVDESVGTGVAVPLVESSGENSIVIVPRANHHVTVADVAAAADAITSAAVLLLQLELPVDVTITAARLARAHGVTVVLNPAPALCEPALLAGLVDVLVPNEVEVEQLSRIASGPADGGRALQTATGAQVVVTIGARGAMVLDGDAIETLPAHAVAVVDTVGAGDAFAGALGARLARGDALLDAVGYANAAAAISVTRAGAEPSMPMRAEVDALLGRAALTA